MFASSASPFLVSLCLPAGAKSVQLRKNTITPGLTGSRMLMIRDVTNMVFEGPTNDQVSPRREHEVTAETETLTDNRNQKGMSIGGTLLTEAWFGRACNRYVYLYSFSFFSCIITSFLALFLFNSSERLSFGTYFQNLHLHACSFYEKSYSTMTSSTSRPSLTKLSYWTMTLVHITTVAPTPYPVIGIRYDICTRANPEKKQFYVHVVDFYARASKDFRFFCVADSSTVCHEVRVS